MKTEKEIKDQIKDSRKAIKDCENAENFDDALIFQGWVEALEFVLGETKKKVTIPKAVLAKIPTAVRDKIRAEVDYVYNTHFLRRMNGGFASEEFKGVIKSEDNRNLYLYEIIYGVQCGGGSDWTTRERIEIFSNGELN